MPPGKPRRYNPKRKKWETSRPAPQVGGRTASEAAFGRSQRAAGKRVSTSNVTVARGGTPREQVAAALRAADRAAHVKASPGKLHYYTAAEGRKQDAASAAARSKAFADAVTGKGEPIPNPAQTRKAAKEGIAPPESMRKLYPRAYREQKALAAFANEGIEYDPTPEMVLTMAAGGAGLAKLGAKAGLKALGKLAVKEAERKAERKVASEGAKKAARRTEGAAGRAKGKAYTEEVSKTERQITGDEPDPRSLIRDGRAKRRAYTEEVSRTERQATGDEIDPRSLIRGNEAPKPVKAKIKGKSPAKPKNAPRKRSAPRKAAATAARHPVISAVAAGALADKAGVDLPVVNEAGAIAEGFARANVGKSAKTTARALPGMIAGVAAPVFGAGQSAGRAVSTLADTAGIPGAKTYSPKEIAAPTVDTTKQLVEGSVEMAKPFVSGDPEKVRKAVEDQVGYVPLLPIPKAVSAARKSKLYTATRGRVRDRVAEARDKKMGREARTKPASEQKRKPRVKDRETGEEYVFPAVGKKINRRRERKQRAKDTERAKAEGQARASHDAKQIIKPLRQVTVPAGQKAKTYRKGAADTVSTVAAYGLPRNRAAALAEIERIERTLARPEWDEIPAGTVTDRQNLRFLRENPELFDDDAYWQSVDNYKKIQGPITTSERKRLLSVARVHDVATPEARMAAGVKVGGKKIKIKSMDPDQMRKLRAQIKREKARQRGFDKESMKFEPGSAEHKVAVERSVKAGKKYAKLRKKYTDHEKARKVAEAEYVRDTQKVIGKHSLEQPAYVKDFEGRESLSSEPRFQQNRMSVKQHRSDDAVRSKGTTDRSFEHLMSGSIHEPRMRRALHRLTSDFVDSNAMKVRVNGKEKVLLTSEEIRRAINRGELDRDQHAVLHSQHFKQASLDPHKATDAVRRELAEALDDEGGTLRQITGEIESRSVEPGHKYVVVPKEAAREIAAQIEGRDAPFVKGAVALNRGASRMILGYNPSWAAAQMLAEGIPAAVAIGANPARWNRVWRSLKETRNLDADARAASDALAGQSIGTLAFPKGGFDYRNAAQGFELTKGSQTMNFLKSAAKGEALGKLDRLKGGGIRKMVVAAKVDKEFNGFLKGLGGSLKLQEEITGMLAGKSLAEQTSILAKHPASARKLETYLDDVMGNWRAITSLERGPASLVAFYPFVRYSMRWSFWTFPKQHPVKATILYWLAQQNANDLEKIIGGKPDQWLDYAFPVVTAGDKKQVMPSATRIAPATNAVIEALGSGTVERLATALNPVVGAAYKGVSGQDPFTGRKAAYTPEEHALLAISALVSMVAPVRWQRDIFDETSIPTLRTITPRGTWNEAVIGGKSDTAKQFEALDPNRLQRSAVNIFAGQSGENYRKEVKLAKSLRPDAKKARKAKPESTPSSTFFGRSTSSQAKAKRTPAQVFFGGK